MGVSAPFILLS